MADNKVKKGFFFYLLMFILLIVAFVGTCMTIMLFNPGKDVLGFCYYKNNINQKITVTTDESKTEIKIDEKNYSEINIDAGAANVILQNNTDYKENGIYMVNQSKGFAKSENKVEFSYSVEIDANKLFIKVNSTEGFLNFSKDANILIHFGNTDASIIKNTNLVVKTTSGSVVIGGAKNTGYSSDIYPASIDIETKSGSVSFTEHATNIYDSFRIKTETGSVNVSSVKDKINKENKDNSLIVKDERCLIDVGSGTIDIDKVKSNVWISSNSGTVRIKEITGDVTVSAESCILDIDKISGNLDFSEGSEIMSSCHIYADEITGSLNIPNGGESSIVVDKVSGPVNIHTGNGSVTLGTEKTPLSNAVYVETVNGKITAFIDDTSSSKVKFFVTTNGDISLNYLTEMKNTTNIETKKGSINFNFNKNSEAKFEFKLSNETEENKFDISKVSFDIFQGKSLPSNPYYYNSNKDNFAATVNVISDEGEIVLDLI